MDKKIFKEFFPEVSFEEWKSDPNNFYIEYKGSYGLFEKINKRACYGHYLFPSAKGKTAVEHATKILNIVFQNKGIETVVGFTPKDRRDAMVMNRLCGFKFKQELNTPNGLVRMYYKTKRMHG